MISFAEAVRRLETVEALARANGSRLTEIEHQQTTLNFRCQAAEDRLQDVETRLDDLESPTPPAPDLSWFEEQGAKLLKVYEPQWHALLGGYSPLARHVIDGYRWLGEATNDPLHTAVARSAAQRLLDAYPTVGRDLQNDLLNLTACVGLDPRVPELVKQFESWGMITGPFREWSVTQHTLPLSFSPPGGQWQGVCTYAALTTEDPGWRAELLAAFNACQRSTGVWGAGWNEGYAGARSTFKAGRDVRLLELDASYRYRCAAAWKNVKFDGLTATEFIDGTGARVGVPLYDGWMHVVPVDVGRKVLEDVLAGRSTKMADVNTHPTGTRQIALLGAVARASR